METNDLNRRIRYAFMLDDSRVLELFSLAAYSADLDSVVSWRLKPGEDGFAECPAEAVNALLNGLIRQKRGPRPDSAPKSGDADALPGRQAVNSAHSSSHQRSQQSYVSSKDQIDNNTVLKQLRIAMALRTEDVHQLISDGGGRLGKAEVNALFRKPDARNYRRCGDQVLRWFLTGLGGKRESLEKTPVSN